MYKLKKGKSSIVLAVIFFITAFMVFVCPRQDKRAQAAVALVFPNESYAYTQTGNTYTMASMSRQTATEGQIVIALPEGVSSGEIKIRLVSPDNGYIALYLLGQVTDRIFTAKTSLEQVAPISFDEQNLTDGNNLTFEIFGQVTIKDIVIEAEKKYTGIFENVQVGDELTAQPIKNYTFVGWTTDGDTFISQDVQSTITATSNGTYKAVYVRVCADNFLQLWTTDLSSDNLGLKYRFSINFINMEIGRDNKEETNTLLQNVFVGKSYSTVFVEMNGKRMFNKKEVLYVTVTQSNEAKLFVSLNGVKLGTSWYTAVIDASADISINNVIISSSTLDLFGKGFSIEELARISYANGVISEEIAKIYGVAP